MDKQPASQDLLREPLLHFVALAILVFVAHWAVAEPEPAPVIGVSDDEVTEYRHNFEERHFRPPTEDEVEQFRHNRIREEILYREGLSLGLDQGDPVIKARIISKMQLVLANEPSPADPGDEVLTGFLTERAERYQRPARYSFELVRLPASDDAVRATLARAVANGADPRKAGLDSERFRNRNGASISASLGPEFLEALKSAAASRGWREVPLGDETRLLRITDYKPATLPALETVRPQVLADWRRSQRVARVNQQVATMAEAYDIQR